MDILIKLWQQFEISTVKKVGGRKWNANFDRRLETVHVMSTVTSITEQHVFAVALASTDAAVRMQWRSRPGDTRLQHRAVDPQLRQTRRQHQRLLPTFQCCPLLLCTRLNVDAGHASFYSETQRRSVNELDHHITGSSHLTATYLHRLQSSDLAKLRVTEHRMPQASSLKVSGSADAVWNSLSWH